MTEDKAVKALRKVIINLRPANTADGPILTEDLLRIDISDKLKSAEYYCLENIQIDDKNFNNTIAYISFDNYKQFRDSVENILDATIVNGKQRESIQKLLDQAFWSATNHREII